MVRELSLSDQVMEKTTNLLDGDLIGAAAIELGQLLDGSYVGVDGMM